MKCAKPSYAFALAMHIKYINKTKQTKQLSCTFWRHILVTIKSQILV